MYLLKKVIQLRENSHPEHEKPFLEHLEDLRVMITRIVITLLVSVAVCFSFQKQLMEVLRRPVEQVWITQLEAKLPKDDSGKTRQLDVTVWEDAKAVERAAAGLDLEVREFFYQSTGPDLAFHARSVALLRAALALPEEKRAEFIASINAPDDLKSQVEALVKTSPSPEVDSRGNLKLMSALRPTETFMLSMKLSFFAGIILAFPLLLMYVLQVILPGLHANEKRVLWPAMLVGFGLFLSGVLFAYYIVLPRALDFFYQWSGNLGVSNDWRIGEYISFATQFTLLFGLSFELPVVVMVLVKLGMLTYETMSRTRSYAVLTIFVTAAVLTPTPDAFTLILMALPMLILYEICIWLAWLDRRKRRVAEEQEAREREESILAAGPPAAASAAASADTPPEKPQSGYEGDYPYESGDEGWNGEYPQQEFHDDPYVKELPPEEPLPDEPESNETKPPGQS